jgi:hypothetical protein
MVKCDVPWPLPAAAVSACHMNAIRGNVPTVRPLLNARAEPRSLSNIVSTLISWFLPCFIQNFDTMYIYIILNFI